MEEKVHNEMNNQVTNEFDEGLKIVEIELIDMLQCCCFSINALIARKRFFSYLLLHLLEMKIIKAFL
jgi:hypothetical protein